jgi:hypothetical protein
MVAGRIIMRQGKLLFIDKEALLREIADCLAAPARDAEIAGRDLATALLPHVEAFYESWHGAARAGCACCLQSRA